VEEQSLSSEIDSVVRGRNIDASRRLRRGQTKDCVLGKKNGLDNLCSEPAAERGRVEEIRAGQKYRSIAYIKTEIWQERTDSNFRLKHKRLTRLGEVEPIRRSFETCQTRARGRSSALETFLRDKMSRHYNKTKSAGQAKYISDSRAFDCNNCASAS